MDLRVSVEPGLPPVLADETLVHQIILNLGANASHAMGQAGSLRVTLAQSDADSAFLAAHPALAAKPRCG